MIFVKFFKNNKGEIIKSQAVLRTVLRPSTLLNTMFI